MLILCFEYKETKYKFPDKVGMLRWKGNHLSKAVCFSFRLVISSLSYHAFSVQKWNGKFKIKNVRNYHDG